MFVIRDQIGDATARVLTRALAELSACIAQFRADLAVGEMSGITPARLAYAWALAHRIAIVANRHRRALPRLADYARDADRDLREVEAAIRASDG